MYAIVEIAGKQFRVSEDNQVIVPFLNFKDNSECSFDKVLLFSNGNSIKLGDPYLNTVSVNCVVVGSFKDDKVLVFKKKRRTGYQKRHGHRQQYTKLLIKNIVVK